MSKERLSPAREAQLIDQMIRDRAEIDPKYLRLIIDLLALGIVNGAWRNTCVENWHAGDGPLSDGDMMRINSHTTWRVRQRLTGWLAETGISVESKTSELEHASLEDVERLMVRLYGWLTNPRRKPPTGQTLGELAGDHLSDYEEDADAALSAVLINAEERGTVFAFKRAAAHGAGACAHWWSHPRWLEYVDAFFTVLDDPTHGHWGTDGEFLADLPPQPELVADRVRFRRLLLAKPWELDQESAEWIIDARLRFAHHQVMNP